MEKKTKPKFPGYYWANFILSTGKTKWGWCFYSPKKDMWQSGNGKEVKVFSWENFKPEDMLI